MACQRRSGARAVPRVQESGVVTRGLFVTFEGIEGCGKTTQVARAAAWMQAQGLPVLATRNPGGTELGRLLRDALLHSRGHIDAGAELLLMMADRRHHLKTMIEPALAEGTHVLCDRYTDASRAYQGAGRGLGEKRVDELHERWCRRDPDRTYLFDLPVETALARVAKRRGASYDRFEEEDEDFHRKVRAAYRRRARREPKRFVIIDASPSADSVFLSLEENLGLSSSLPGGTDERPRPGRPPRRARARAGSRRWRSRARRRSSAGPASIPSRPRARRVFRQRASRPHGGGAREAAPRESAALRGERRQGDDAADRARPRGRRRRHAASPTRRRAARSSSSTWIARRPRPSARS